MYYTFIFRLEKFENKLEKERVQYDENKAKVLWCAGTLSGPVLSSASTMALGPLPPSLNSPCSCTEANTCEHQVKCDPSVSSRILVN